MAIRASHSRSACGAQKMDLVFADSPEGFCSIAVEIAGRSGIRARPVTHVAMLWSQDLRMTGAAGNTGGAAGVRSAVTGLAGSHIPALSANCASMEVRGCFRQPSLRMYPGTLDGPRQGVLEIAAPAGNQGGQQSSRKKEEYDILHGRLVH